MRAVGSFDGPIPEYEPYMLEGDFRSDGRKDVAVIVTVGGKAPEGTLLIFDAPFPNANRPAFTGKVGSLRGVALFKSPKGPWPVVGEFESEACVYMPAGKTYVADCAPDD